MTARALGRPILDHSLGKGALMDLENEGLFVVFLRKDFTRAALPIARERELARCATYEEACSVREELSESHRHCVIRCVGPTGGGD